MANRYNPRGLLSPLQSLNIGGGVDPLSNIDPLRGQSLMGQPVRMPSPSIEMLGPQQPIQPQQGFLGRTARDIGDVFTGEGSSARLTALAAALSQGPSATPVSFGRSFTQGLAAGNVAAQQEAERKRKLLIEELRAKRDGASGIVSAKTYRLPDGDIVETFADKNTLQRVYVDEQGNKKRVPVGAIEYSRADVQRSDYFDEKLADIRTDERRIKALDSYLNSVEGAEQGFKRFFDRIQTSVKTFIDSGELTKEELSTAEGQAKLQGLLGMFREDIVGGGVMTEFDAIRVIRALGGDFNSLQNREVVKRVISDLRQQSIPRYQSNVEIYNSQLAQVPAGAATSSVYKPHTPMSFTRQTPSKTKINSENDPLGLR